MEIGANISRLRKSKKMTQADLAKKLNVTSQAVSRWENDVVEPNLDTLKKLKELFGVSYDDILS